MAQTNWQQLAQNILDGIGGKNNIQHATHCMTRLRFQLKDEDKADTQGIKNLNGVVNVVQSGGQYQVVIGEHVAEVYEALEDVLNKESTEADLAVTSTIPSSNSLFERFLDLMSSLFQPIISVLSATGIIKGLVALLTFYGMGPDVSGVAFILNAAGDAFFQFLPIMIGLSAARRFKLNDYVALAIVGSLVYPRLSGLVEGDVLYTLFQGTSFEAPIYKEFFHIPIMMPPTGSYLSSIIPAIFAVWVGSKLYRWIRTWMPSALSLFFTPFLTVIFTVPLAFLVIGPLTTLLSNGLGVIFNQLYQLSPVVFAAVVAGLWQILVIFGLHWSLVPLGLLQLSEYGQSFIFPLSGMSTFGVFGALLALYLRTKDKKDRQLIAPTALSAFFGITEPAIYGYMLPLKPFFGAALLGNLVGGVYVGLTNVVSYRLGGAGIFSLPSYIPDSGDIGMNLWHRVISFALATGVAFVSGMMVKRRGDVDL